MTLIRKISVIAGLSIATSSAGAVVSYSSRNIAKIKEKVKEKTKFQNEYDTDFFHWKLCCRNSSTECEEKCIHPMEIF